MSAYIDNAMRETVLPISGRAIRGGCEPGQKEMRKKITPELVIEITVE